MKNKKGLSEVVTNVLIILLVIIAIALLWGFLLPVFTKGGAKIQQSQDCMNVHVETTRCIINLSGLNASITVSRAAGKASTEISEMKIILERTDGTAVPTTFTNVPAELGANVYAIPISAATDAAKAGVAVGFRATTGEVNYCPESARIVCF